MSRRILSGILVLVLLPASVVGPSVVAGPGAVLADTISNLDDNYADLAIGVPYEDVGSVVDGGATNVLYGSDPGGLTADDDQYWHQDVAGVVDFVEASDIFASALASGDFDGNGYADLAVGVPYQDVGSETNAGAVHILYGASDGLTAVADQLWTQDSSGIEGAAEEHDWFGLAVAAGDFDGDGYDDLAIGVPAEDIGTINSAGAVNIIYGSASGLSAAGDQVWHQDSPGIQGGAETSDQFGYSLAAGDFTGDGHDDLAIGVVHEDVGSIVRAGSVNVIYGSSAGLTEVGDWWFHQDTAGILDVSETDDVFGWAVTAGDFDGDGYADLAIGAPGEDLGGKNDVGAVNVVYGTSGGLTVAGDEFWNQDVGGTQNEAEDGDRFGRVLAAGDFDGNGRDDMAVGMPYEDNGPTLDAGAVHVIYGSSSGLTTVDDWCFFQSTMGMLDTSEQYDYFGRALAAGDFDGDTYADLAIGVPYEDLDAKADAGAVNVVYGTSSGLNFTGNQFWNQDSTGVINTAETGDRFGYALAALSLETHKVYLPFVTRDD